MFVLHGVIFGTPDGVPSSGVRSEHGCYYRNGHIGINTSTYPGYKERTAVYGRRCITSTASSGCCIVRSRIHRGTLFDSTMF